MPKRQISTLAKPGRTNVKLLIICGKQTAISERPTTITDRRKAICERPNITQGRKI